MNPIRNLLLGLDLGPSCEEVWRETCTVARTFGARVHILHVLEDVPADAPGFALAARGVEGRLNELVRGPCAVGAPISPHYFIRGGNVARAIISCSRELSADLVVIGAGAGAAGRVVRAVFGNCAEDVVRAAEVPVWIVRPRRGRERFERVLAAVDPVGLQREVIDAAGMVARAHGGRVEVVAVVPPRAEGSAVQARLRDALVGTAAEGLDVRVEVRRGARPAAELVLAAEHGRADLLVMGERARRGLRRLLARDTVEALLRAAPCSILKVGRAPVAATQVA